VFLVIAHGCHIYVISSSARGAYESHLLLAVGKLSIWRCVALSQFTFLSKSYDVIAISLMKRAVFLVISAEQTASHFD